MGDTDPNVTLPPIEPEPEPPTIAIRPGKWWFATLIGAGLAFLAWHLRNVLTPFLLAFLLAWVLSRPVRLLERVKVPRAIGALVVFLVVTVGVVWLTTFCASYFAAEIAEAGKHLPAQAEALLKKAQPTLKALRIQVPHSTKELVQQYGQSIKEHLPDALRWIGTALFGTLSYAFVVLSLLIIPIFAYYILVDFDRIVARGAKLVPRRHRRVVFETIGEIDDMVSGYMRGQVLAMIILSTLYAVGLQLLGLRLAIPIGVLTGLLAFIPYLGFVIGLAIALTMAAIDGQSMPFVVQVAAMMAGIHILDVFVITPRAVGRSVGLASIEVLLAMAAAGSLFGFVGVLFAVPIGATVKIVVRRAVSAYRASLFYRRAR